MSCLEAHALEAFSDCFCTSHSAYDAMSTGISLCATLNVDKSRYYVTTLSTLDFGYFEYKTNIPSHFISKP